MKHNQTLSRLDDAQAELESFEHRAVPSYMMFFIGVASGVVVISTWLVTL